MSVLKWFLLSASGEKTSKTRESHESTRQRVESSAPSHEDHMAGKGFYFDVALQVMHKFLPMPQAMKILDAKAAVHQGWKELETIQGGKVLQGSLC